MRSGGAASTQTSCDRRHCSFVEPSPCRHKLIRYLSLNLANTVSPVLVILRPAPPNCKALPVAIPYKQPVLVHATNCLEISQMFTNLKQAESGLCMPCTFCKVALGPALGVARPILQVGLSMVPPNPVQVPAICIPLCSSCQVARGSAQVVVDLGTQLSGGPRTSTPADQIQTTPEHHPPTSISNARKDKLSRHQSLMEASSTSRDHLHSSSSTVVTSDSHS